VTDTTTDEANVTDARQVSLRGLVVVYLKGAAMGGADSVPGVSGGTIALITGIYERLIGALTSLDPRVLRHVPRLHRRQDRREFRDALRRMDVPFLVALGLGAVTSLVTLSRLVHTALELYRPQTFAFFFGLIAASAVVLYRDVTVRTAGQAGAAVAGFVVALVVTGASGSGLVGHALPVVFVAGSVAVTATVLPGISGAFILILLGQYEYLTGVLKRFVDDALSLVTGGNAAGLIDGGVVVAVFGVGAIVGILVAAHTIRSALERYRVATLAFLVSLMVGSLRYPAEEVWASVGEWTPTAGLSVAGIAVVGAVAVILFDHYTADIDYA